MAKRSNGDAEEIRFAEILYDKFGFTKIWRPKKSRHWRRGKKTAEKKKKKEQKILGGTDIFEVFDWIATQRELGVMVQVNTFCHRGAKVKKIKEFMAHIPDGQELWYAAWLTKRKQPIWKVRRWNNREELSPYELTWEGEKLN